jgi:hypothetical protein
MREIEKWSARPRQDITVGKVLSPVGASEFRNSLKHLKEVCCFGTIFHPVPIERFMTVIGRKAGFFDPFAAKYPALLPIARIAARDDL